MDAEQRLELLEMLRQGSDATERLSLTEENALCLIRGRVPDRTDAAEMWESLTANLREPQVLRQWAYEWHPFRKVLEITRLPGAGEIERIVEYYSRSTPGELERRMRALTGYQFELFLGELLIELPMFERIIVTKHSYDGGIDFRGNYIHDPNSSPWPLMGQAKQVSHSIGARDARDFVGALDTCGLKSPIGLFICTNGFSKAAMETFESSRFRVLTWGMDQLRSHVLRTGVGVRAIDLKIEMPNETFWDEIVRESKSS
jgi:hypothetical protein